MIAHAVLLLMLGFAPGPFQSFEAQWQRCVNADLMTDDADIVIGACNALLQSGRVQPADVGLVLTARGNAYLDKADYGAAISDFDRAIGLANNTRSLVWALRRRAFAYEKLDRLEPAVADLSRALQLAPDDAWLHEQWGTACYRVKKDLACAFDQWQQASAMDATARSPFYDDALVASGDADLRRRQYGSAVRKYRSAQAADMYWLMDVDLNIRLARALRRTQHADEAVAILDEAVRDVGSSAALIERAATRITQDQEADAIADLNRVLEAQPSNATALYLRGVAQQRLNSAGIAHPERAQPDEKWDSAEADITRALSLDEKAGELYGHEDLIIAAAFRPPGLPETIPSTPNPPTEPQPGAQGGAATSAADDRNRAPAERLLVAIAGEQGTVRRRLFPFALSISIGLLIVIRRLTRRRSPPD